MPKKPAPRVKFWSYSAWSLYTKCPAAYRFEKIDRRPAPKGAALIRGQDTHEKAEAYTDGRLRRRPPELDTFDEEFKELRRDYKAGLVRCEEMISLDRDWNVVTGDPFDPRIWLRVKADAVHFLGDGALRNIDHKTGKVREEYVEQLDLQALAALIRYAREWDTPVRECSVELWYLDHGVIKPDDGMVYTPKDIPRLKKEWTARVKPMFADRRFDPRPSGACNYCHYRKSNGGPCPENL